MADNIPNSKSITSLTKLLNKYENTSDEPTLFLKSQYYTGSNFIRFLKNKSKFLKVLSLNCQSLNAKFDLINIFINQSNSQHSQIDIICLQETWLAADCDISLYKIDGYNLISSGKICSEHGGVAMYIREDIEYKVIESCIESKLFDGQIIEISLIDKSRHYRKFTICNIYRPPQNNKESINSFMKELNVIFHKLGRDRNIILSGDFNIDLLKFNENAITNDFLDFIVGNNYIPRITLPTRIGQTSRTLIDNFFVNISHKYCDTTAGIIWSHISDHLPYFITLDYFEITHPKTNPEKMIEVSPQNLKSMREFQHGLQNKKDELDNILCDNPDCSYEKFNKIIQELADKHFPTKYEKFNKYKHKINKWVTVGILKSIKQKDKLYVTFKSTPPNHNNYEAIKRKFKIYNRILKWCIRSAKRNYYHNKLELEKNDIRKTWKTINEIMNRNKHKQNLPDEFAIDDKLISDRTEISNRFNEFFSGIGMNLCKNIDMPTDISYKDFLTNPSKNCFAFQNIENKTIITVIDSLKPKNSIGHDKISCKLLKFVKHELANPLKLIINQSFQMSIFPSHLKIARIIPVHKKGDIKSFDNYRPISILPAVSKVFERIMHNQMYSYFNENQLFYTSQYGFRHGHSTELACLELVQNIINNMDTNKLPINVYLDLSKAFDSLNHDILLYKLSYYGFRGKSLELMKNYLSCRKQYVEINNQKSKLLEINCGVPQGSIVGPLLFVIYVNDIMTVTKKFHPIVYADDTTLTTSINFSVDDSDSEMQLNKELNKINDWLKINKLTLNINKTKCMIFHTHQKSTKYITKPKLSIDNVELEFVDEFNFLGILIDKHMTWKSHVTVIAKKLTKTIGIMSRLRNTLPYYSLKTIYNSLILPYLNNGLFIWGWQSSKLFSLQKRAIRIIANLGYLSHTTLAFKKLNILKLPDLCSLHELKFCFKLKNNLLPCYFYSFPILKEISHNYSTRQNKKYWTPAVNHEFAKNGILYKIPHLFNGLQKHISDKIETCSIVGFKTYIKKYFIDNYPTNCTIQNCFVCGSSH